MTQRDHPKYTSDLAGPRSHGGRAMSEHWRQRPEAGGYAALWLMRNIALHGGRRLSRALLYPITLYFFMRRAPERTASRAFLTRIFGKPASAWQVMRHIHCFSVAVLDRVFFLAHGENDFDIEVEGVDTLEAHLARGNGMLLLGSHFGSFEALRAVSGRQHEAPLRVVLNKRQTPATNRLLDALAPDVAAHIIDGARDPTSVVLALAEAAAQGDILALLADRGRTGESMLTVPFLGQPAAFPVGPWRLAAALRIPVMLCFGVYCGGNRYRVIFEHFEDRIVLPRGHRDAALRALLLRYAERLQHHVRLAPYNWFNLYDFWNVDERVADRRDDTDAVDIVGDGARD